MYISCLPATRNTYQGYIPGCMRKSCRMFVVSLGVDCTAERKALHVVRCGGRGGMGRGEGCAASIICCCSCHCLQGLVPEITKMMEEGGLEFDLVDPFFCCPDNFCCDTYGS